VGASSGTNRSLAAAAKERLTHRRLHLQRSGLVCELALAPHRRRHGCVQLLVSLLGGGAGCCWDVVDSDECVEHLLLLCGTGMEWRRCSAMLQRAAAQRRRDNGGARHSPTIRIRLTVLSATIHWL